MTKTSWKFSSIRGKFVTKKLVTIATNIIAIWSSAFRLFCAFGPPFLERKSLWPLCMSMTICTGWAGKIRVHFRFLWWFRKRSKEKFRNEQKKSGKLEDFWAIANIQRVRISLGHSVEEPLCVPICTLFPFLKGKQIKRKYLSIEKKIEYHFFRGLKDT